MIQDVAIYGRCGCGEILWTDVAVKTICHACHRGYLTPDGLIRGRRAGAKPTLEELTTAVREVIKEPDAEVRIA